MRYHFRRRKAKALHNPHRHSMESAHHTDLTAQNPDRQRSCARHHGESAATWRGKDTRDPEPYRSGRYRVLSLSSGRHVGVGAVIGQRGSCHMCPHLAANQLAQSAGEEVSVVAQTGNGLAAGLASAFAHPPKTADATPSPSTATARTCRLLSSNTHSNYLLRTTLSSDRPSTAAII